MLERSLLNLEKPGYIVIYTRPAQNQVRQKSQVEYGKDS